MKKSKKHTSRVSTLSTRVIVVGCVVCVCVYAVLHFSLLRSRTSEKVLATTSEIVVASSTTEELLGKAELSFAGGTVGRNKNIEIGIGRIDGTVVQPGEEFSFTKSLGSVSKEDGFSEEKIFQNGEVTKGVGGGLCQVSTTLFQSALHAGLPITERHNHSYSVSYYDVGLDAAYADPGPDLKFVNDTGHPITIRGSAENHKAVFEIYGVRDGRIASTSEAVISKVMDFPPTKFIQVAELPPDHPACINTPQIGYTAQVMYEVQYPHSKTKNQTFTSVYRPLQRVCSVLNQIP